MFHRVYIPTRNLAKSAVRSKRETIDRYLPKPPPKPQKEWEKRGMDKNDFFVKKYSYMSEDKKNKLGIKIEREQRAKRSRVFQEAKKMKANQKSDKLRQRADDREFRSNLRQDVFSEYIYGTHAVLAALSARKRHSYQQLFLTTQKEQLNQIVSMAKKFGIKIEETGSKNQLNILTNNAVHNGVVLEARKLDLPEITSLGSADSENGTYELEMWNQDLNAKSIVTKPIARDTTKARNPLGLYLDEITDPQNVGNIIRTAYFLGVDFVVTPSHNSARLGPATAKAAAGALDLMDIYQVNNGLKFMRDVKQGPWSIITTEVSKRSNSLDTSELSNALNETPVLLVLGSEGSGVRTNLTNLADFFVSLPKNRNSSDDIVDCLNVGTATSIIISRFLE